jgi:hypothetical protein
MVLDIVVARIVVVRRVRRRSPVALSIVRYMIMLSLEFELNCSGLVVARGMMFVACVAILRCMQQRGSQAEFMIFKDCTPTLNPAISCPLNSQVPLPESCETMKSAPDNRDTISLDYKRLATWMPWLDEKR